MIKLVELYFNTVIRYNDEYCVKFVWITYWTYLEFTSTEVHSYKMSF